MEIFEYSFMIQAFTAGVIIAMLAPSLGIFIVVRRYSMLSDSLAHISLLGVAFGFLCAIPITFTALLTTLLFALLIEYLRQNTKIYSDSLLSVFLSGSLAISIITVSSSSEFNASLFDYLFGSILAVSSQDIYTIVLFGIICMATLLFFYKQLIFTSFDSQSAQASGINVAMLNYVLVALTAIMIGLAIKIVGVLLISALMVIPVITAMRFGFGFYTTAVFSVIISVCAVIIGLFISYYASLPSGASIVVVLVMAFILSFARLLKK